MDAPNAICGKVIDTDGLPDGTDRGKSRDNPPPSRPEGEMTTEDFFRSLKKKTFDTPADLMDAIRAAYCLQVRNLPPGHTPSILREHAERRGYLARNSTNQIVLTV